MRYNRRESGIPMSEDLPLEKLSMPFSIFKILIAFLLCWINLTVTSSYAEGVDSSGGTTGTQNRFGESVSFDLWVNDPEFRDPAPGVALRKLLSSGFRYGEDQILPAYSGSLRDQALYPDLIKRLDLWSTSSPVLTQLLRKTLDEMHFFEIRGDMEEPTDPWINRLPFFKPALNGKFDPAKAEELFKLSLNGARMPPVLFPVAVFDPVHIGSDGSVRKFMVIYGKAFHRLGRVSQEAVFLKEALRVIQSYRAPQLISIPGRAGKVFAPEVLQMSHATAQRLVYEILLTHPSGDMSLDNPAFYSDQLRMAMKLDTKALRQKLDSVCSSWDAVFNALEVDSMLSAYCKDGRYASDPFSTSTIWDLVSVIRYRVEADCLAQAKSVNDVQSIRSTASYSFEILNAVSDTIGLGILQ